MSETTIPFVINVSEAGFKMDVLERSREVPVLVDFWATWCAPCRQLSPVLEKVAQEFNGRFILAKVNTEENPYLAQDYQVRSIPHVMMFRNGQPVDAFVGLYPEAQIRAFLQRHCPNEADSLLAEAQAAEQAGQADDAETLYRRVLALDPEKAAAQLAIGRAALRKGQMEEAATQLKNIAPLSSEEESARRLLELMTFMEEGRSVNQAAEQATVTADSSNLDAHYQLAAYQAAQGRFTEAMDELLAILARNKRYRDEAARRAMLAIFTLLGERSAVSDEYRQRLARTLY